MTITTSRIYVCSRARSLVFRLESVNNIGSTTTITNGCINARTCFINVFFRQACVGYKTAEYLWVLIAFIVPALRQKEHQDHDQHASKVA
ncbi:hypothetical protein D934_02020 [Xylella fastidiosa subsp. sandyi Ann-1]|uniref:Uncharacterized protein n=1 Tax=Xylella fastidiosa subsp. sandyi Ann-1 TaxID=155920 RepID=A0A060H608_XYLFS|nr:hypothetical protein D934_02020 [Xylella fastidiosa subsp. sandyi Ann-1]